MATICFSCSTSPGGSSNSKSTKVSVRRDRPQIADWFSLGWASAGSSSLDTASRLATGRLFGRQIPLFPVPTCESVKRRVNFSRHG